VCRIGIDGCKVWLGTLIVVIVDWQVLLELDPFLNELTKLYEQTKKSGTVCKSKGCLAVNSVEKNAACRSLLCVHYYVTSKITFIL